jgi:hypothetical protein
MEPANISVDTEVTGTSGITVTAVVILFAELFSETTTDDGTSSVFESVSVSVPEAVAGADLQEDINRNNKRKIHKRKIFFSILITPD